MSFTKKSPHRPKMANTAYEGRECQVGKGSEEGWRDRTCPRMEHLGQIWHKQGPSSQTTCTINLDKTTKSVMKIIQFSLSAYLLKANQIIAWHFFPTWTETNNVTVLVGGGRTGRQRTEVLLQWSPAVSHRTDKVRGKDSMCSTWSPAETQHVSVWTMHFFKWDGGENFFILLHTNVDQNVNFCN